MAKQNAATVEGQKDGKEHGERFTATGDNVRLERQAVKAALRLAAMEWQAARKIKPVDDYCDAFESAALATWAQAHRQLPEVKTAERNAAFARQLDYMEQSSGYVLREWQEKAEQNGLHYAFEWGDDAVAAAAQVKVVKDVRAWLTKDNATLDAVVNQLERAVWQAARWPKRSTSPLSNLTAQAEAAAQALLLESVRGW
jgi:ribosomal protein L22